MAKQRKLLNRKIAIAKELKFLLPTIPFYVIVQSVVFICLKGSSCRLVIKSTY